MSDSAHNPAQIHSGPPGTASAQAPSKGVLDRPVFYTSLVVVLALVILGVAFPTGFADVTSSVLDGLVTNFSWAFVLTATGFVVFAAFLAFSKYGRIRLGADDEKPAFSRASWMGGQGMSAYEQ